VQAYPTVWILLVASLANAYYTITRVRNYRLFEVNIEKAPQTPSARRVKVQSESASSSPLRFLTDVIANETAESRAHADKSNDVWEISVWDPLPLCMQIFCLFSPGHVLVYLLFVPIAPLDPRPSVTVFNCILLQVILSGQLLFMQSRFTQQGKDMSIIHREVLHEYDTKFVHPRLHPVVRDVSTQVDTVTEPSKTDPNLFSQSVSLFSEAGTPTTVIKREFQTHPNPNYTKHINPDSNAYPNVLSPRLFSPAATPLLNKTEAYKSAQRDIRSPAHRQSLPAAMMTPRVASPAPPTTVGSTVGGSSVMGTPVGVSTGTSTGTNFGGNLGVYSHARSPLKKAISMGDMKASSPRNSREMAALEQRGWNRDSSPLQGGGERGFAGSSLATGGGSNGSTSGNAPRSSFANARLGRGYTTDRYPSRWA